MTVLLAYPDGSESPVHVATESQPTEFWEAGYLAFCDGKFSTENPYPSSGFQADEWTAGWAGALKEFEAAGETDSDIDLGEPIA